MLVTGLKSKRFWPILPLHILLLVVTELKLGRYDLVTKSINLEQ
jgi:hypothetical protein